MAFVNAAAGFRSFQCTLKPAVKVVLSLRFGDFRPSVERVARLQEMREREREIRQRSQAGSTVHGWHLNLQAPGTSHLSSFVFNATYLLI